MIKRVNIPLNSLDTKLLLIITDNIPKVIKNLGKQGCDVDDIEVSSDTDGLALAREYKERMAFISIIRLKSTLEDTLKVLVHELYHSTNDILDYKEIPHEKGGANETYAYMLDYLFGQSFSKIASYY